MSRILFALFVISAGGVGFLLAQPPPVQEAMLGQLDAQSQRGRAVFSDDGRHLAYEAARGEKHVVVWDGKAGVEYDGISEMVFSPDGEHLVYGAYKRQAKKCLKVVDGNPQAEFDGIFDFTFSTDRSYNRKSWMMR
jgi:hypothetical protein